MNRHLIALTFAMTLGLAACTTPISTPTPEGITELTSSLPVQAPVETPVAQTPLEPDAQNVPFGGVKLFGGSTSNETPFDAATDANGNVYVVGSTDGAFAGQTFPSKQTPGFTSGFVMKINARGVLVWARIIGSTSYDAATKVAVSSTGSVYVTGVAGAQLQGKKVGMGSAFNFLTRFDANGKQLWVNQFGSARTEVTDLRVDSNGQPLLAVINASSLQGVPNATGAGAFLIHGSKEGPFIAAQTLLRTNPNEPFPTQVFGAWFDQKLNVYVNTMRRDVPASPTVDPTYNLNLIKFTTNGSRRFTLEYPHYAYYKRPQYTVDPSGTVFLNVITNGAFDRLDRYDENGKRVWGLDGNSALAKTYVTGVSDPRAVGANTLIRNGYDGELVKLNVQGAILQKHSNLYGDYRIDAQGNYYFFGSKLAGVNLDQSDVFVAKYNNSLVLQ
jgi:Beta-propeller repeat